MGVSASSLLDDNKSNYIKGEAEALLKDFSPHYRKQFSVARFSEVEDDLEQHKEKITQLLKQREAPEEGEVLYEESVLYFDDTRKWRERYVVVRANYCLECHDSLETFVRGVPPRQKLLPTGGAVLTTEEKYMALVDKCFPDDTSVKEDFAPPLSGMPGQFPVYLRLPYRRDSYFCFKQQAKQDAFLSILSDCIRHQNQDFLKKKTCEVQAFLKAIQLYRQDKGRYEAWDMVIGSDVRVMANLVMEQLLPSLEKDMLPRLKAKKTEKKRVWFATVEAAYILVQEHLLEGLGALKEDCRTSVRQQEVVIHSDMDQILQSRRQLEERVRDKVSEPAERLCCESVQPYLGSVLEELMEPISSGFQGGRQLSESMMDQVCQDWLLKEDKEQLKQALAKMSRPNLLSCYLTIGSLQEKLQHLQERFGFSNITGVIHSAQIDLQQLMENAAHTFEQLLLKAVQDNPDGAGAAIEKAKHRVLKQYDYDSSTVRKRISREALVSITLPFIKKNLAPTCKTELQNLEQSIDADHGNFIHIENVYENILLQSLDKEVTKVVKEAASLKKYNLFTDSRDLLSQSSRSSLSSPPVSTPSSPAMALASPAKASTDPPPPSPLAVNGLSSSPQKEERREEAKEEPPSEASTSVTVIETPLGEVDLKETAEELKPGAEESKPGAEESKPGAEELVQAVQEEISASETTVQSATPEGDGEAAAQTVTQEEVSPVLTAAAEPRLQGADAPNEAETTVTEIAAAAESLLTDTGAAPTGAPDPTDQPSDPAADGAEARSAADTEEEAQCGGPRSEGPAPPGGQTAALTAADILALKPEAGEAVPASDPNSLDVSVGSESAPSDVDSGEDEVTAAASDVLQAEADVSTGDLQEPESQEPAPEAPEEAAVVGGDTEAAASVEATEASPSSDPPAGETTSSPEASPLDSIKEIRDLVVEVIEVEELVQHYPDGVPKEE